MLVTFTTLVLHMILAFQLSAAAQPVREITSQAMLVSNQPIPAFHQGYVFFTDVGHRSHFTLYSPDGQLILDKDIQEGKSSPVSLMDIVVDTDGKMAVAWATFQSSDAGIDFLDATGKQIGSIDTGAFVPQHMTFGADHSLWTFGVQRGMSDPHRPVLEYMTVQKYALDGGQVGAYLPRSLFPHGLEPACLNWQEQGIAVASDRIGLLACSGMNTGKPEWLELDLNGNLVGRWRLDAHRYVAFTQDGHLYAQDRNTKAHQLFVFDRASSTFRPIASPTNGKLEGAAGDDLVFSDWNNGPMHFLWFKQP